MTDNSKPKKIPKKRGRKPKNSNFKVKPPPKKRGRKPKGGKIIKKCNSNKLQSTFVEPNIILHLKCSTKDLKGNYFNPSKYTPEITNPIAYNIQTNTKLADLQYKEINSESSRKENTNEYICNIKTFETQTNNKKIIIKIIILLQS